MYTWYDIDMICIHCGHSKTSITNSRPQNNKLRTWRRRKCLNCNLIFTTNEVVDDTDIKITISSKVNKPFNLGQLTTSIFSSFAHNQEQGSSASFWIATSVKYFLLSAYTTKQKEIHTQDIAEATYETLKRFDNIAAVQYAARHNLIKKP